MHLKDVQILKNDEVRGGYYLLVVEAPALAAEVEPGQFVHIQIMRRKELVLRRPFSVFKADERTLSVLYKSVGQGTESMAKMVPGERLSLMGPLGKGFPSAGLTDRVPLLVAGGYGMAALYLVAVRSRIPGVLFVGGAGAEDILCVEDFEQLGWRVEVATEDGSLGTRGRVTDILDAWIAEQSSDGSKVEYFACGPLGMLRAVGQFAEGRQETAWLSMDHHMGCGVGACLTCVQKIKTENGGWKWARICKEGPVFESRDILWDDGE